MKEYAGCCLSYSLHFLLKFSYPINQIIIYLFQKYTPAKIQPKKHIAKKKSIFSKAPKFILPKSSPSSKNSKIKSTPFKRQLPKVHKPINKHSEEETEYSPNEIIAKTKQRKTVSEKLVVKKYKNSTLPNSKNNKLLKNKFRYFDESKEVKGFQTDIRNIDEETDNKLMNLLDTLEQEVKHIELDGSEKQLFDAKLRKIYGSLVAKPNKGNPYAGLETTADVDLTTTLDYNHVPDDVETINNIVDKQISETEDRVQMEKQFSDNEDESRQERASPKYALKDQRARTPIAGRSQSLPETNYKTITDDEPNYVVRKNTKQNFQKLKQKYYTNDDNMTPIERSDNFKDRSRPRHDTYKERSIYRSDNYKFQEPYVEKKDYERDREVDMNDRRFDSENNIIKGRSMYKNEDYNDYKTPFTNYPNDDANIRAKPRYEEENMDGHLDFNRRQFYQEKLNKLERKLHGIDNNPRHDNVSFFYKTFNKKIKYVEHLTEK